MPDRDLSVRSAITRRLVPVALVAVLGVAGAACKSGNGSSSGGTKNAPTTAVNSGSTPTTANPGGSGGAGF